MEPIRKRSRWDRARDLIRKRPRTPVPTAGWTIRELSAMTGVTVRTLRNYVSAGLITPMELRGNATRYQRKDLMELIRSPGRVVRDYAAVVFSVQASKLVGVA